MDQMPFQAGSRIRVPVTEINVQGENVCVCFFSLAAVESRPRVWAGAT